MKIIHVNFRDKEYQSLLRKVDLQLQDFGFNSNHEPVPLDAVACALDEVHFFSSSSLRLKFLARLEAHYLGRSDSSISHEIDCTDLPDFKKSKVDKTGR